MILPYLVWFGLVWFGRVWLGNLKKETLNQKTFEGKSGSKLNLIMTIRDATLFGLVLVWFGLVFVGFSLGISRKRL